MNILKKLSVIIAVGIISGCGGGGGGGGGTSVHQVTGRVSISGLTENVCGIELRMAYPAEASYTSTIAVGNASSSLVVADTTNRSNSVAITTAASTSYSGNGEVLNIILSSPITNGFRLYSTSVRNCSGVLLQSGLFALSVQ